MCDWKPVTGIRHAVPDGSPLWRPGAELPAGSTVAAIAGINRSVGEADATVYWVMRPEACPECRRLYRLPDGKTPRLWRLSEVLRFADGPEGRRFAVFKAHHDCDCSIVTLAPGFGFDDGGACHFVGFDHREIERQRARHPALEYLTPHRDHHLYD